MNTPLHLAIAFSLGLSLVACASASPAGAVVSPGDERAWHPSDVDISFDVARATTGTSRIQTKPAALRPNHHDVTARLYSAR